MRNLLALGAAGFIGFAGVGWYLGWYSFTTNPTATGRHISIDLNTPKIKQDIVKGEEKVRDYLSDGKGGSPNVTPVPNSNSPGSVQPTGFQRTDNGGFVIPGTGGAVTVNPPNFPQK